MRIILSLFLLFSLSTPFYPMVFEYGNTGAQWENVNWRNVKFYQGPDGSMDASLAENEYSINSQNKLLVLHFNHLDEIKPGQRIKEFIVDRSSVVIDKARHRFGGGAALFYRSQDTIAFRMTEENFFQNHVDTGPFTFEFWMNPFSRNDGEIVFQKYGPVYRGGKVSRYSGVKVYFSQGVLVWEFYNLFKVLNQNNRYAKVRISSRIRIPLYKWHHHALTYDPVTGKLTYYVNGKPVNTIYCTDTGEEDATVLAPGFNPREFGLFIIGKGFQGIIDEFVLSAAVKHSFRINRYAEGMGLIRSGVIDTLSTGTSVNKVQIKYQARMGAGIVFEYRISNKYFNPDKPETIFPFMEYNLDEPGQNERLRGRFIQWRIKLLGSENGKYSPVINTVRLVFSSDRVPFKPIGLVAVSYNKKVYLTWQGNTENDIAGYKIYYGNARGVYNGTRAMEGFSPIQVPVSGLREPLNPRFELSGLKVNELYYITITAYDRSGQESPFAREVYVRVKRFNRNAHSGMFQETND